MNAMQGASTLTLYIILIVAVVQDFKCMKISNRLILIGLVLAMTFGILQGGMSQIIYILLNISFPVIILYFLYLLGVLGAGDIKLFSVIGGFTNFKMLMNCMLASFVAGAVISDVKMLYHRNLSVSLLKGQIFMKEILRGNISSYRKTWAEESNLMHFSLAILIGVVAAQAYNYWG